MKLLQLTTRSIAAEFMIKISFYLGFMVLLILVFEKTNDITNVGYISVAMLVPSAVFTLFSNKIVFGLTPEFSFRYFSLIRGIIFIILPFYISHIILVVITAAVTSFLYQIIYTSKLTYDSVLVKRGQKIKFNARRIFFSNIATIIGPALAGFLISYFGSTIAVISIGIANILAMLILAPLPDSINEHSKCPFINHNTVSFSRNTWDWLKAQRETFILLCSYAVIVAILEMEAPLIFPLVKQFYNGGANVSAILFSVCGVGGILGALFINLYTKDIKAWFILMLLVLDGTALYFITIGMNLYLTIALFALLGVISSINIISVETRIQETAPKQYQPFLFSVLSFAGGVGGSCLTLISTSFARFYGVATVLQICAFFEILLGIASIGLTFFFYYKIQKQEVYNGQ